MLQSPSILTAIMNGAVRSQALAARILETVDNLILIANTHGHVIYASPSVTRILGYSEAEILGTGWLALTRLDSKEYSQEKEYLAAVAQGVAPVNPLPYERKIYDKQGQPHWILWQDTKGVDDYVIGIGYDITERKTAELIRQKQIACEQLIAELALRIRQSLDLEQILEMTVQEVRQLLATDRVMIYRFTPTWTGQVVVESVAPGCLPILGTFIEDTCLQQKAYVGYQKGRVTALNDVDQLDLNPCYKELLQGFQVRANLVVPIAHNQQLWGLLIAHHCQDARLWQEHEVDLLAQLGTHLAIAIQQSELISKIQAELVQREAIEIELRVSLAKEKELGELKSRFVAMASHEIRTPLTTIFSATDLMLHYSDRITANEQTTLLQEIQTEVKQLNRILEDTLEMSKVETDQIPFYPEALDLVALSRETVTRMGGPIIFNCSLSQHQITGDRQLLRQVLTNLLSNALKYSQAPVILRLTAKDQHTIIEVQDRGIGIPAQDLEHLFEPFHRAKNVAFIPGTGLGLTIVKRAVSRHGGQIEVQSTLGVGTTFTLTLPGCSHGDDSCR